MIEAPVTKCDSGTQTDTHFMESNIVKSYEWNEWELRRKALKLVSWKLDTYRSQYYIDNFAEGEEGELRKLIFFVGCDMFFSGFFGFPSFLTFPNFKPEVLFLSKSRKLFPLVVKMLVQEALG